MMKKPMITRVSTLVLLLILSAGMSQCKKDKDPTPEEAIIGDWKMTAVYEKQKNTADAELSLHSCTKTAVYSFKKDGVLLVTYPAACDKRNVELADLTKYAIDTGALFMDGDIYELSFSGNTMTINFTDDDGDGVRAVFTKK